FDCAPPPLDYPRSAQRFPLGFLPAFEAPAHGRGFLLYCGVAEPKYGPVYEAKPDGFRVSAAGTLTIRKHPSSGGERAATRDASDWLSQQLTGRSRASG